MDSASMASNTPPPAITSQEAAARAAAVLGSISNDKELRFAKCFKRGPHELVIAKTSRYGNATGYMFITLDALYFHGKWLNKRIEFSIPLKDIVSVEKVRVMLIPAIRFTTRSAQVTMRELRDRDEVYSLIISFWNVSGGKDDEESLSETSSGEIINAEEFPQLPTVQIHITDDEQLDTPTHDTPPVPAGESPLIPSSSPLPSAVQRRRSMDVSRSDTPPHLKPTLRPLSTARGSPLSSSAMASFPSGAANRSESPVEGSGGAAAASPPAAATAASESAPAQAEGEKRRLTRTDTDNENQQERADGLAVPRQSSPLLVRRQLAQGADPKKDHLSIATNTVDDSSDKEDEGIEEGSNKGRRRRGASFSFSDLKMKRPPSPRLNFLFKDQPSKNAASSGSPAAEQSASSSPAAAASASEPQVQLEGDRLLHLVVNTPIEQVAQTLFGNNSPVITKWHEARKTKDVKISEWSSMESGGTRSITFVMPVKIPMSSKTSTVCNESHTITRKESGQVWLIEQTVKTPDVPYGECFHTVVQVALTAVSASATRIQATIRIVFTKSTMFKSAIQKGTLEGSAPVYQLLEAELKQAFGTVAGAAAPPAASAESASAAGGGSAAAPAARPLVPDLQSLLANPLDALPAVAVLLGVLVLGLLLGWLFFGGSSCSAGIPGSLGFTPEQTDYLLKARYIYDEQIADIRRRLAHLEQHQPPELLP